MLKFVETGSVKVDPYVSGSEFPPDSIMPHMQYLKRHLKEVWYGLVFAQYREDSWFPNRTIDAFISLWQDRWLHTTFRSIDISKQYDLELVKGSGYTPMQITYCGEYTPFPEQFHEAHIPKIWNDHTPPDRL